jgi:hypothetical protein
MEFITTNIIENPVIQSFLEQQLDLSLFDTPIYTGSGADLIAKLIGISIIAAASLVKLPSLYNVAKSGSSEGFALSSVYAEVIMFANAAFYGFYKVSKREREWRE